MRFEPSGAARTTNLHGVELRVNRSAAQRAPLPAALTHLDTRFSEDYAGSRTMGLAHGGSAAVSVDLARCSEEMAEVQQRRNALEQQLAAFAAIDTEGTAASRSAGDGAHGHQLSVVSEPTVPSASASPSASAMPTDTTPLP